MLWNCIIEWKHITVTTEQQIYFVLNQYSLNLYTLKCWVEHATLQSIHWSVWCFTQLFRVHTEVLSVTLNFRVYTEVSGVTLNYLDHTLKCWMYTKQLSVYTEELGVFSVREERKRRKGFWKVALFFLSSFFVCFLMVLLRCGDLGPGLDVFCVLRIRVVSNSRNF